MKKLFGIFSILALFIFGSCNLAETTVPVTGVNMSTTVLGLKIGDTFSLVCTVSPGNASDQSITWSSSNTTIATVSTAGLVRALTAGTTTITVTSHDGNYTATCIVTVTTPVIPVTSVLLSLSSLSLDTGAEQQLLATVYPANASNKNLTWTSMNESIATISSTGKVKGIAVGSTTIKVTTEDGSFTDSLVLTVTAPVVTVTGISLTETSLTMGLGGTHQLLANLTPTNASNQDITWSSTSTSKVKVSSTGLLTAQAKGTATIKATSVSGGYVASCLVTVGDTMVTLGQPFSLNGFNATVSKVFILRNAYGTKCYDSGTGQYIMVAKIDFYNGTDSSVFVSPLDYHIVSGTTQVDYTYYTASYFYDENLAAFNDNESRSMTIGTSHTMYVTFETNSLLTGPSYKLVCDDYSYPFQASFTASDIK